MTCSIHRARRNGPDDPFLFSFVVEIEQGPMLTLLTDEKGQGLWIFDCPRPFDSKLKKKEGWQDPYDAQVGVDRRKTFTGGILLRPILSSEWFAIPPGADLYKAVRHLRRTLDRIGWGPAEVGNPLILEDRRESTPTPRFSPAPSPD